MMPRFHVHLTPGPQDANDPKVVSSDPVITVTVTASDDSEAQQLAWHFLGGTVSWDVQEIEGAE